MSDPSDLPLFAAAASARRAAPRSAEIVAWPMYRNRRLVADLAREFEALAGAPDQVARFERDSLGVLADLRRYQGFPPDLIQAEIDRLEDAVGHYVIAQHGRRIMEGQPS